MNQVYLGLGGNEGDILTSICKVKEFLEKSPAIKDLKMSNIYRTAPVGMVSTSWFLNAVCTFKTPLSPFDVFAFTQEIETQLGKIPKAKDAPRPIDIDILFHGVENIDSNDLKIPHREWHKRLFVLMPLSELTEKVVIKTKNGLSSFIIKELIAELQSEQQQFYLLSH